MNGKMVHRKYLRCNFPVYYEVKAVDSCCKAVKTVLCLFRSIVIPNA